jgi:hypothetical protein
MPPSRATADAKPASEIPTDIPPWIIGNLATKLSIFSSGSISTGSPKHRIEFQVRHRYILQYEEIVKIMKCFPRIKELHENRWIGDIRGKDDIGEIG